MSTKNDKYTKCERCAEEDILCWICDKPAFYLVDGCAICKTHIEAARAKKTENALRVEQVEKTLHAAAASMQHTTEKIMGDRDEDDV